MKNLKITVLAENTSAGALPCEHGLSLYIEYNQNAYLLDAGASDIFMHNAASLSVNLEKVKLCILSHGHYDHATGFEAFLEAYPDVPVYAMRSFDGAYYSDADPSRKMRYIGVPESLITVYRERFCLIDTVEEIDDGIWAVPHSTHGLKETGRRAHLYVKKENSFVPDGFNHEMSVVFDSEEGLVIICSCAHAGLLNILNEVHSAFPNRPLYAFIGGLHMMGIGETCLYTRAELIQLKEAIAPFNLRHIYTGHCTGQAAYAMLKDLFGETTKEDPSDKTMHHAVFSLSPLSTGLSFTL